MHSYSNSYINRLGLAWLALGTQARAILHGLACDVDGVAVVAGGGDAHVDLAPECELIEPGERVPASGRNQA